MSHPNYAQDAPVTVGTNPRRILRDLALHAGHLKGIVVGLSDEILDGADRKEHVMDAIERASQPAHAKSKLPIPSGILEPSYLPRTSIGVIGSTGLGKSTLLSSVLGRNILPSSAVARGTAAPTIVVYHPLDHIEASLTFMTSQEVRGMIDSVMDLIEPDENGRLPTSDDLKDDPWYKMITEALVLDRKDLIRIKNDFNNADVDSDEEPETLADTVLEMYPELVDLLDTTVTIAGKNADDFCYALESCIGAARDDMDVKKWAFLTCTVIKCNADVLSDGTILVDLPGSGDCSTAVLRTIEKVQQSLDVKLVVVRPQRASTEAVVIDHITEEIKRRRQNTTVGQHSEMLDANTHPEEEHRTDKAPHASSSGLAIIMTQCDAARDDDELKAFEADRDVGRLLENARGKAYQKLVEDSEQILADCSAKRDLIESLLRDEKRLVEELSSHTRVVEDLADSRNSKRIKLEELDDEFSALADGDPDDDNGEECDSTELARIRAERQELEKEVKRPLKRYEQCMSQRRVIVSRARYLVPCALIRRRFGARMMQVARDADGAGGGDDQRKNYEDSLPVFATSARDFGRASGNVGLELRTGVPALREFIRYVGARVEHQAALDLLQPFRAEVDSTYLLLTAIDSETMGEKIARQKHKLKARWASREPPKNAQAGGRALRASTVAAASPNLGIRQNLEAIFAEKLKAQVEHARTDLKVLEATCEEGARAAAEAAEAKARDLVDEPMHWGKHRATLKHHGIYSSIPNYNIALADPLIQAVEKAVGGYCGCEILGFLQVDLVKAANGFLREVRMSAKAYDTDLQQQVHARTSRSLENLRNGLDKLKREGNTVFWESRHRSTPAFFGNEVLSRLEDGYDECMQFKGKGSIAKMKAHFVNAVSEAADTMFDEITREFVEYQGKILDQVEALIKTTCTRIAKECELEISNAWVVPAKDQKMLETRSKAAKAVGGIARSLSTMETGLVQKMRNTEKEVPTCYPAPWQPSSTT